MIAIPSTLHNYLKFEYEGKIHIVATKPKPYALCNPVDLELEGLGIHHIIFFYVPPQ